MEILAQRTKNFSSDESRLLLRLAKKHAAIIECKKTDQLSCVQKDRVWKQIEEEFTCSTNGPFRCAKVLKTKYLNLKATFKKPGASEKRSFYETAGGSPPQKLVRPEFDDESREILPEKQISGLTSRYDCDRIIPSESDVDLDADLFEVIDLGNDAVVKDEPSWSGDVTVEDEQCSEYAPSSRLKTSKHEKLKATKHPTQTSWAKLAAIKAKWTEANLKQQMEMAKIEHEQQVLFAREKHELEKEKLQLEIAILRNKLNALDNGNHIPDSISN